MTDCDHCGKFVPLDNQVEVILDGDRSFYHVRCMKINTDSKLEVQY